MSTIAIFSAGVLFGFLAGVVVSVLVLIFLINRGSR